MHVEDPDAAGPRGRRLQAGSARGALGRGEEGSEVVSHVLVQALVLLVVLALLQLAFALHTRNMAIAAVGEGARRGALLGAGEADAVERTQTLLDSLIGVRHREVTALREPRGAREVLVVTVRTDLPLLLDLGPSWLQVSGSAIVEEE